MTHDRDEAADAPREPPAPEPSSPSPDAAQQQPRLPERAQLPPLPERGRPRVRRRATTPPPPGTDPSPLPEPGRHRLDENDDRLKAEKPPHY